MGSVLTFDRRGQLLSSSGKVARPKGTTVQVSNLFGSVPVRRKEFERNSKKQFNNATTLIQAYGLISEGVRLSVTNQLAKKPVQSMFKTDGKNVRENYAILFTARAALTLMDFDITLDFEAEKRVLKLAGVADLTTQVRVTGIISKPVAGSGRTSSDRQFFFINGRPVETKAISKAFNEVYKGYLPNHLPSIVADFQLPTSSYDVNVSPDKRSIFLHSERNLVDALKTALDALFQPYRSTYAADGANLTRTGRLGTAPTPENGLQAKIEAQTQARARQLSERSGSISAGSSRPQTPREEDEEGGELLERSRSRTVDSAAIDEDTPQLEEQATREEDEEPGESYQSALGADEDALVEGAADTPMSLSPASSLHGQQAQDGHTRTSRGVTSPSPEPDSGDHEIGLPPPKAKSLQMTLDTRGASWNLQIGSSCSAEHGASRKKARTAAGPSTTNQLWDRTHFRTLAAAGTSALPVATAQSAVELEDIEDDDEIELEQDEDEDAEAEMDLQEGYDIAATSMHDGQVITTTEFEDEQSEPEESDALGGTAHPGHSRQQTSPTDASSVALDNDDERQAVAETPVIVRTDSRKEHANESEGTMRLDMARLRRRVKGRSGNGKVAQPLDGAGHAQGDDGDEDLEAAGIAHDSQQAEQALSRLVSKADFAEMEIVGQFNLAFIIARRRHARGKGRATSGHDDLMIIDQHASDEKYNFERLQLVTKIDSQRLIRPRELNLTASDELLAIEHEDVLRFNGFEIEVDEDAPSGQRIKLVAMPVAKATKKTEFTIDDLEELLFLLRDHTGSGMLRPSKTRKLFAMLACRSSVMVGRVLNTSQMTSIVRHMGTMDQPWNCPHGRNTMRWLKNLQTPPPDPRFCIGAASLAKLRRGD